MPTYRTRTWTMKAIVVTDQAAGTSGRRCLDRPAASYPFTHRNHNDQRNRRVIPERLAPVVEAGIMPEKLIPDWEIPARGLYKDIPQRQRDEAVRTATFGAAAMIYVARSWGLGSTPMIGFDDEAVHREFGLAEDEVPVLLLSVGAERPGNWPEKPRRPVVEVLDLV